VQMIVTGQCNGYLNLILKCTQTFVCLKRVALPNFAEVWNLRCFHSLRTVFGLVRKVA